VLQHVVLALDVPEITQPLAEGIKGAADATALPEPADTPDFPHGLGVSRHGGCEQDEGEGEEYASAAVPTSVVGPLRTGTPSACGAHAILLAV
jgi:hypothetical protein